jgi:hypothetical protein
MNPTAEVALVQRIENLLSGAIGFLSSGSDIEIVIKSILVAGFIALSMVVAVAVFLSAGLGYGRARSRRNLPIRLQRHLETDGIVPPASAHLRREVTPRSHRKRRAKIRRPAPSGTEPHPYFDNARLRVSLVIVRSKATRRSHLLVP